MRSLRITAIALIAAVALTGCTSGDSQPAAEGSPTPTDSPSATPDTTVGVDEGNVSGFPKIDGFTYKELPNAVFKSLNSTIEGTPQVQDVQAKLVTKNGQEVGLVMRMAIEPEAASAAGFEEAFLPGFASGVAGSSAKPGFEEINGTKVVTVDMPGGSGAALAWFAGSVATVLVFKDDADAKAFAQGALG